MSMKFDPESKKSAREQSSIVFNGPGRVKQSFSDAADINKIVRQYKKTGVFQNVSGVFGSYTDVSQIAEYKTGLTQIRETQEAFDLLPAEVREKFENDPVKLLEFVTDDKNIPEARKLGLVPPAPAPDPEPGSQPDPSADRQPAAGDDPPAPKK